MGSNKNKTGLRRFNDYVFSENRVFILFVSAMAVSWLVSLIYFAYVGDGYYRFLFYSCGDDTFMDFYNSIRDAAQGLACYTERLVIYPPLANLIFLFFSGFTTERYNDTNFFGRLSTFDEPANMMAFTLFAIAACAIVMNLISKKIEGSEEKKSIFAFFCIFNCVFVYAIERGNILIIAFALTVFFLFYHDSKKRWVQHLAYICLALAAAIKIYPALFGLLLIIEKKYKDAIITVIYGVLFFCVPFAFYGGIFGAKTWLNNLLAFTGAKGVDQSFIGKVSMQGILWGIHYFSGGRFVPDTLFWNRFGIIFPIVVGLVAFFILPKTWQKLMAITIVMLSIPGSGGSYGMIFFIPALVLLANDKEIKKHDYLYVIALLVNYMVFPLPVYLYNKYMSVSFALVGFVTFAIVVLLIADIAIEVKSRLSIRRKTGITTK